MADHTWETNLSSQQVKAKLLEKLRKRGAVHTQDLNENAYPEVSQPELFEMKRQFPDFLDSSKGGPLHLARAVILSDGSASFQVLLKAHTTMELFDEDEQSKICWISSVFIITSVLVPHPLNFNKCHQKSM